MNVLFDARTLTPHYPGVGRYGHGLLAALARLPDLRLTTLVEAGQAAALNLPALTTARARSLADQLATPGRLRRGLPKGRWVYHSPFYMYPYGQPLPAVVTLYDVTPLLHPAGFSVAARLAYGLAHRLAAGRARRIITLTAAARDDCVRRLKLPAAKFVVVPPGHTPPSAGPKASSEPFLLYVGINKPHKNLPRLIEAYAGLGAGTPPLVIAGPLDARFPQAQRAAERLGLQGRVHFLGRVAEAELARLYQHATLLVLPSLAEGFGFPVLEAMSAGTPVVCSDLPVLREVAGKAAVYFDPRQREAIQTALRAVLSQPALAVDLRKRGQARAQDFSWARAARETLAVYQAALAA